jgi:hypothetical protein
MEISHNMEINHNMEATLAMDQVLEVVSEACLEACSVEDHRYGNRKTEPRTALTTSSTTSQTVATTATLVPRQVEPTPALRRPHPTTPVLRVVNTAAVPRARVIHPPRPANNTLKAKPTEATAHNNTLPSPSTASTKVTARKLVSVDSQDTVGQHLDTVRDHRQVAHQAATDNKVWARYNYMERDV